MAIEYRVNAELTPAELAGMFKKSGIDQPVDDKERLANGKEQPPGITAGRLFFLLAQCYLLSLTGSVVPNRFLVQTLRDGP